MERDERLSDVWTLLRLRINRGPGEVRLDTPEVQAMDRAVHLASRAAPPPPRAVPEEVRRAAMRTKDLQR